MKSEKDATEHLFFSDEMVEIGARIGATGPTRTSLGEWAVIVAVARISDLDLAMIAKSDTMSSESGRQDTVKHIHTMFDRMTKIIGHTDTHEVSGSVRRKQWSSVFDHSLYFFRTLTDTDSPDRDTVWCVLR